MRFVIWHSALTKPNRQKFHRRKGFSGSEIVAQNRKSLAKRLSIAPCNAELLSLASEIAVISGVPRWASQPQIAKFAAISVR